jgi:hypothetical protein
MFAPSRFTHHSNYAGDLIFGARTHQPQKTYYGASLTAAEAVAYITSHVCSALKTVHVGFSMGIAGTEVAKEVSDMSPDYILVDLVLLKKISSPYFTLMPLDSHFF